MNQDKIIEEIIKGIVDFKIIPFFGAGMSKGCGALDWGEIIRELNKELATESEDYLKVAQEYEDKFGRDKLISKLEGVCKLSVLDSSALNNHLKILSMNPPIVYTTNYDNAIEEASNLLRKKYRKIVDLNDIVNSAHGEKQIIKFHGDFSNPESIVFTQGDYDKRLEIEKYHLDVLFRSHLLGKSVLFLGYGFGDINIDYIFQKHSELYGNSNLPKSYIVSFSKNEKKEAELKGKNVTTLFLESVEEFNNLIDNINSKVFNKSFNLEIDKFFKPLPSEVLTSYNIDNLLTYVKAGIHSNKEKVDKIRQTIEGKTIPSDVEQKLYKLFNIVFIGDFHDDLKEAFLISFPYVEFKDFKYILNLCFDIIALTENPKFILDLSSDNWGSDALMIIERKVSQIFKESIDARKFNCGLIIGYLEAMIFEDKNIGIKQVYRLFDALENCGYSELDEIGYAYSEKEKAQEVLELYFEKYDSSLKARFLRKGIFGRRIPTIMEISEELKKSIPKNM